MHKTEKKYIDLQVSVLVVDIMVIIFYRFPSDFKGKALSFNMLQEGRVLCIDVAANKLACLFVCLLAFPAPGSFDITQ